MNVLFGKVFGLGNAVMAVPAIKAIAAVHGPIDVLVGSGPDDGGALDVMQELRATDRCVRTVYDTRVPDPISHDVAVMSIPFDGRWRNGTHFHAEKVIDGRPRPGDPAVVSLDSWELHEAEYQMQNAVELGHSGPMPSSQFSKFGGVVEEDLVYVGLGYKRDAQNFWSKKHWGNDRFVSFVNEVRRLRPKTMFVTTGGNIDLTTMIELGRGAAPIDWKVKNIRQSFRDVAMAGAYFGNDTGMAHVAGSFGRRCYVMTAFAKSEVKNPPLGASKLRCERFDETARDPEAVAADFVEFAWGDR